MSLEIGKKVKINKDLLLAYLKIISDPNLLGIDIELLDVLPINFTGDINEIVSLLCNGYWQLVDCYVESEIVSCEHSYEQYNEIDDIIDSESFLSNNTMWILVSTINEDFIIRLPEELIIG